MATIAIDIKSCKGCPFLQVQRVYTNDSFERPEEWRCKQKLNKKERPKKISGWVDWYDKVPVPKWCPIKIDM